MQQLRNDKLPNSYNDLKYFTKRERPTRHTYMNMEKQYRARTKFSSLLPLHQFTQIWSDLPAKFRDIKNINYFKGCFRAHILDNYTESIVCVNRRCRQCFT